MLRNAEAGKIPERWPHTGAEASDRNSISLPRAVPFVHECLMEGYGRSSEVRGQGLPMADGKAW